MTLEKFIRKNRKQIDKAIKRIWPKVKVLNDEERKVWILNETNLLHWVETQGAKIDREWGGKYSYDSFLSGLVRRKESSEND